MTTLPGSPRPAPEPKYVVVLRLVGAFGLLVGIVFTGLMWAGVPGARWIALAGIALFPATALLAAAIGIYKGETSKAPRS
jgi:hypothetical protein